MQDSSSEPTDAVDADLGPGDLSTRGLPTARRGYEKKAVDALVASAVERWSRLYEIHAELLTEVRKSGGADHLARDLGAIGQEVERILAAANEAAERLRQLAVEDADRIGAEAGEKAAELVEEADRQAQDIRRSAWEEGTRLLESAATAAEARLNDAREDQLRLRAEGEREAHRRLAVTRKETDDMVRQARYEADQHLDRARLLARKIIETAESGNGADGGGDEARREAMLEIEKLRAAQTIEDVAVLSTDLPRGGRRGRRSEPNADELGESLIGEVERLQDESESLETADDPAGRGSTGAPEIQSLFQALRTTEDQDQEQVMMAMPVGPIAERDRRILGLHNVALREVKRRIARLQDAVVGDGARALPSSDAVGGDLTALLSPVIPQAAAAGAEAARQATGVVADPGPGARVPSLVSAMASDLVSQVRSALTGGSTEETAIAVRRVFRQWRTDEAERWVRTVLLAAYHDAMLAALAEGGFDRVRGVPSDSSCRDCLGTSSAEWDPAETRKGVPPVDIDCRCFFEVARSE